MSNQGFRGALKQYWDLEPKARLSRKNTFFNDHTLSNYDALKVGLGVSVIATAIICFWCIGVIL